jgi:hypothetical protein
MTTKTTSVAEAYDDIRRTEEAPRASYAHIAQHYAYSLPDNAQRFDNIDALRRAVTASGSHYFDADAVRIFLGRTDPQLFDRRFFVESRRFVNDWTGDSHPREYQVAYVYDYDGGNLNICKIGSYASLNAARKAAARLAAVCAAARTTGSED